MSLMVQGVHLLKAVPLGGVLTAEHSIAAGSRPQVGSHRLQAMIYDWLHRFLRVSCTYCLKGAGFAPTWHRVVEQMSLWW